MLRIGVIMYQTSLTKGQELVAQRMVREFRKLGADAYLITSAYQDSEPVVSPEEIKKRGGYVHVFDRDLDIPVIRVSSDGTTWPPRRISFVDFVGVLTNVVEDLKLNVLITHSTLWNGPEEVVKFVAWKRKMTEGGAPRSPLVFCHMSHFQAASDERYVITERSFREAWNKVILPQVLREADVVLATTPYEAELMKRLGADSEKILLFPGGIDDEAIATFGDEASFRAKHGLPPGSNLVSFLGTVEERKNPLAIVAVAKLLTDKSDLRFVIAGRMEGEYAVQVKTAASSQGNVSVIGPVSEEDKAALIRTSMLNINLSRSESLGISQLEFMSAGVPVITSGVGGQSWIVRDGLNGVIVDGPDDTKGAAEAVRLLTGDPLLREKMSKAARRSVTPYSITRLVDGLSKRLRQEIRKQSDDMPALKHMPDDERVIEAWVHKRQKVAATSRRLVVRSEKNGQEVTSVPYDDISRIVRYSQAPWPILLLGGLGTLALLFEKAIGLGLFKTLAPGVSALLSPFGLSGATGAVLELLPMLPLAVSSAVFLREVNRGYLIQYGPSRSLFLPTSFGEALRLADKLTPRDLFEVEDGTPETTTLA